MVESHENAIRVYGKLNTVALGKAMVRRILQSFDNLETIASSTLDSFWVLTSRV